MHAFFFHGFLRMDWGLGNPNKTAALIAILMVAVWGLAYIHRWGFWLAVGLFATLGVCEIDTYSRGGLIAAAISLGILVWTVPRPWTFSRVVAIIAAFWIIIGASVYFQASDRYKQGVIGEDLSITHRIQLWKTAPVMMVDAPGGWGIGNSGRAYIQWYQALDHKEKYRTLVSSHLTWLVEVGWPLRFLYLFMWMTILILCFPYKMGWQAIPFCIWISLLVASSFSSIAECIWIWVIPIGSLLFMLIVRYTEGIWPQKRAWATSFLIPLAILFGLYLFGSSSSVPAIHKTGSQLVIGTGKPRVWVVENTDILGDNFGKKLREQLPNNVAIGIVDHVSQLPELNGETVVVCGDLKRAELSQLRVVLPKCGKLVLLNPGFNPRQLTVDPEKTTALIGDFSDTPNIRAWAAALGQSFTELKGVGNYIDNWPQLVLSQRE